MGPELDSASFLTSWCMHSLVLATSQHFVNILTSPGLTVLRVSPVTTVLSAMSVGKSVATHSKCQAGARTCS